MKAPQKLTGLVGPFKVDGYDQSARAVQFKDRKSITLKNSVLDTPKIGYNYAFKMLGNDIASDIYLLTVDIVIHTNDEVLLIKRKNNPFAGRWALPGGFVDPGESFQEAAIRELKEETGLRLNHNSDIQYVGKFDKINRDPRMKNCISMAFSCRVDNKRTVKSGDDASATKWVDISKLKTMSMAFDHKKILQKAGIL